MHTAGRSPHCIRAVLPSIRCMLLGRKCVSHVSSFSAHAVRKLAGTMISSGHSSCNKASPKSGNSCSLALYSVDAAWAQVWQPLPQPFCPDKVQTGRYDDQQQQQQFLLQESMNRIDHLLDKGEREVPLCCPMPTFVQAQQCADSHVVGTQSVKQDCCTDMAVRTSSYCKPAWFSISTVTEQL